MSPGRIARVAITFIALWMPAVGVPAEDTLAGTWRYAGSAEQTARRVASIEAATDDLSFLFRGRARDRLRKVTTPSREIRISLSGDEVVLGAHRRRMGLRVGAPPRRVQGKSGTATVGARRSGDALVITSRGENGGRVSTYRLSEDGQRLTITVRMTGERLSTPIRYRLTYRRIRRA